MHLRTLEICHKLYESDPTRFSSGICHSINWYAKANNKCMKDLCKNKELSDLQYWDINNLYGWEMSQKFPVNNFDWIEDTSQS